MDRSLDPGYALAHQQRDHATDPRRITVINKTGVAAMMAVVGLFSVWLTSGLHASSATTVDTRSALYSEIAERQTQGQELLAQQQSLQTQYNELQNEMLNPVGQEILRRTNEYAIWSGTTAVEGPGLVITISDSPSVSDNTAESEDRVQDYDLQQVINALRASGAEAISINGQRLTATTPVRSAGAAVLVDLQPTASPYRIEAIGDPSSMRSRFAQSTAMTLLLTLSSNHGIEHSIQSSDQLVMPAGRATDTYLTPVDE